MLKCVTGNVTGFSHIRRQQPCQDSVEIFREGESVILAVADGHGNQMHKYSADGSKLATECAVELFKEVLSQQDPKNYIMENANLFPQQIEINWKNKVREFHYKMVEEENRELVLDRNSNKPQIDSYFSLNVLYGTTLLAAVYGKDYAFAMQIGDGDIAYVDSNGNCDFFIEGEDQVGSATNSLCMLNSQQYFRTRFVDFQSGIKPILMFLSTDGYSNSYRDDTDFLKLVSEYTSIFNKHTEKEIKNVINDWLSETSKLGSGDDISVAIVYNQCADLNVNVEEKSPSAREVEDEFYEMDDDEEITEE